MIDSETVVRYIESRYSDICERPQMYAMDPESLEEVLIALEDVREFLLSGLPVSAPGRGRYFAFLAKTVEGAATYVARRRYDCGGTIDKSTLFQELCTHWNRFRQSSDYMSSV